MREVDAVGNLRSSLVGALHTDDGELVANFDLLVLEAVLASVARGTPTGIAAVDVEAVVAILQVYVAILGIGNLVERTCHHVVDVGIVFLAEELGNGDTGCAYASERQEVSESQRGF